MIRRVALGAFLVLLPKPDRATELIFHTAFVRDAAALAAAQRLGSACADVSVRFRLNDPPGYGIAALNRNIAWMEHTGSGYYVTAASSDYGLANLFWDPRVVCEGLTRNPHAMGLYLHEIISARVGSRQSFSDSDWRKIGQYAECAKDAGKRILWNEWAGGSWGWQTFLAQTSASGTLANRTLTRYENLFVFLWANNRNVRASSQRADMLLAESSVDALGDMDNPSLPQGVENPVRFAFAHGISIQDWYWFESHKDATGRLPVGEQMPASVVTEFGAAAYRKGARYFEFEAYWSNPMFLEGITELRDGIVRTRGCAIR